MGHKVGLMATTSINDLHFSSSLSFFNASMLQIPRWITAGERACEIGYVVSPWNRFVGMEHRLI